MQEISSARRRMKYPKGLPYLDGPVGSSHEMAAQYLDLKPKMALWDLNWILQRGCKALLEALSQAECTCIWEVKRLTQRLRRFISIFPRIQSGTEMKEVAGCRPALFQWIHGPQGTESENAGF